MKVRTLLVLLGDQPLSEVSPEGMQVTELINKYSPNKYDISTLNGKSALAIIESFASEQSMTVLNAELNDGLDLTAYRKQLQGLVDSSGAGKWMRPLLAFGFSTLLAFIVLSYAVAVGWVAYHTKSLPDWPSLLIVMGGPVAVVWQYSGILTQERRDLLVAAIGRTPQGTILGGVLSSLKIRKEDQPNVERRGRNPSTPVSNDDLPGRG